MKKIMLVHACAMEGPVPASPARLFEAAVKSSVVVTSAPKNRAAAIPQMTASSTAAMTTPQETGARNERQSSRSGVANVAPITKRPTRPIVPEIARSARHKRSLFVMDPRRFAGTRSFERSAFHIPDVALAARPLRNVNWKRRRTTRCRQNRRFSLAAASQQF